MASKGWIEEDYRVAMSQVQSAPLGCISVEVMCIRHEDADDATHLLQRSRVLEINTGISVRTSTADMNLSRFTQGSLSVTIPVGALPESCRLPVLKHFKVLVRVNYKSSCAPRS